MYTLYSCMYNTYTSMIIYVCISTQRNGCAPYSPLPFDTSQAMASRLSSSFRLVDFFRLGGAMPEEVVNGHGSQMLNLWVAGLHGLSSPGAQ